MKSLRFTLLILLFAISFAASGQINHKHYITMGRIDLSKEDFNAAIQNLNVAIQAKPNDFEAYFLRGIAKFSLNDFPVLSMTFPRLLSCTHCMYVPIIIAAYPMTILAIMLMLKKILIKR